jgi:hypothetical protein
MSRKRIPALPVPVKNLLELYNLEATAERREWGGYVFVVRKDVRHVASMHPPQSVDDWIRVVVSLRKGGYC